MSAISDTTNNLYEIYVNNNISLVQSIVIKFDQIAQTTNLLVLQNTGVLVDPNDRSVWKYYQNISGQYNFSDTLMSVYSLDSETTINFTIAELALNPVTAAAYSFGSQYYNELLAAYPTQEMLILGILYPCDIDTAINAQDGTILSYPGFLVEAEEVNFISLLQTWIYAYINRWIIFQFGLTDDLYPATYLAQLYLNLVSVVANIRLAACKTNQAHSFHVKQFLRSHGFIDVYLNEMTQKQILNMYRNINYYERNAGFETTFNTLINVLFTDIGFPVYEYVMEHRTDGLLHESLVGTSVLLPTATFKRKPLNSYAASIVLPDYDLTEVMAVMAAETTYNAAYQTINQSAIETKLDNSISARLGTKVIECALNPRVTTIANVPDEILFNQWIALVANDKYAVPVEYTPLGAIDPIRLTHQQALALWVYATQMALAPTTPGTNFVPLVRVPPIYASHTVLDPKPTLSTVMNYVDTSYTSATSVSLLYSTAVDIPAEVTSLVNFTLLCQNIYEAQINQKLLSSFQEDPHARSQLQAAALGLYSDEVITLASLQDATNPGKGITYVALLEQVGLVLTNYQPVDYFNMALTIYQSATGSGLNINADPSNIQASMISLMTYLSSYSLQFIASGISDLSLVVNQINARINTNLNTETALIQMDIEPITVTSLDNTDSFYAEQLLAKEITSTNFELMDQEQSIFSLSKYATSSYIEANELIAQFSMNTHISVIPDQATLFNDLTALQRMSIVDVYRN